MQKAFFFKLSLLLLYNFVCFYCYQENQGGQRVASITSSYPGPSHSVAMMTSSISSDEDMLDITTTGTTQVTNIGFLFYFVSFSL